MFKIQVRIANPADPDKFFEEYFRIETGALYTSIPENRLQTIGLEPISSRNLILADGRHDKRLFGEALFTNDMPTHFYSYGLAVFTGSHSTGKFWC